jgi:hypothetical protein
MLRQCESMHEKLDKAEEDGQKDKQVLEMLTRVLQMEQYLRRDLQSDLESLRFRCHNLLFGLQSELVKTTAEHIAWLQKMNLPTRESEVLLQQVQNEAEAFKQAYDRKILNRDKDDLLGSALAKVLVQFMSATKQNGRDYRLNNVIGLGTSLSL